MFFINLNNVLIFLLMHYNVRLYIVNLRLNKLALSVHRYNKLSPFTYFTLAMNASTHLLYNLLTDRKSQACSISVGTRVFVKLVEVDEELF